MEDLPLLCLRKVFGYLPNLNEQIRCSSTCKKWRAWFEQFRPKTLCLYVHYLPINKRLEYTKERFSNSNSFSVGRFHEFLASEITRSYFSSIRKLAFFHLDGFRRKKFPLPEFEFDKHLNHFKELEILEMKFTEIVYLKEGTLDLPKLKVLSLARTGNWWEHKEDSNHSPIVLNTPSLEVFDGQLERFDFLFPGQLRHLCLPHEGYFFSEGSPPIPKFKQEFPNLESLILLIGKGFSYDFSDSKFFSDELLSSLPKLKRLIVMIGYLERKLFPSPELAKQIDALNLRDLEILMFAGSFLDYPNWKEYTKFFGQIDHLPFSILGCNFGEEMKCGIPPNYFSGYLNIHSVYLGGLCAKPEDQQVDHLLLLKFFKAIGHLSELEFRDPCPLFSEQSFFDSLPDCLSIKSLVFYSPPDERLKSYLLFNNLPQNFDSSWPTIGDHRFLTRLHFGEIKFFLRRKRFSHEPIFSILKNETFHSVHFVYLDVYLDDNQSRYYDCSFKKNIANKSSFQEFVDCSKCQSDGGIDGGEQFGDQSWEKITKHVIEHLVVKGPKF